MIEDNNPRILIFGPPFNSFSGGGITLTNLFKGWPKEKIAVTSTGHVLFKVSTEVCNTYYLLGTAEQRWIFPLNLLQRPFPSGLMSFDKEEVVKIEQPAQPAKKVRYKTSVRQILVDKIFYPFIHWLGLFHCMSEIHLTENFKVWLSEYKPEILYLQVSSREDILFSIELCNYLSIPTVIHMMDDWPSTISKSGLFHHYWQKKIDRELKQLLNHMDLYLSISDAMTNEYKKRYSKGFRAFHNPIETQTWAPFCKTNFRLEADHVKILYSGRIGIGITESLIEIAHVIDTINLTWGKVKLYIQSPSSDTEVRSRLQKFDCIVLNPAVEYSQLPFIFSQADLLVIANDFDKAGIDFLKYSMPTKVSEYMISGTPVLIYCPAETAVARFFDENECGCCVTEQDPGKLNSALKMLISDENYRRKLSEKAVSIAKDRFDAEIVKNEFQQLLINLSK
jgi:glycosyltransferase involved in cell wall biosynthesis